MPDQQPVVSQRAKDAAQSILWVKTLIDDRDAIEQTFARVEAECTTEVEKLRAENARLREAIHGADALAIGSNCRGGGKITLDFERPKAAYKAFTIISDAYNSSFDSPVPEGMELRPFAHCCAEGGGDVNACDCVNKNHGVALFSVRKPTPTDVADHREAISPTFEDIRQAVIPVIGACLLMHSRDPKLADPRVGVGAEVANAVLSLIAARPRGDT